jgi:hypothetical protein
VLRFGGEDVVVGAGGVIETWAGVGKGVGGLRSCSWSWWAWGWVPIVWEGFVVVVVVRDEVEMAETLFRAVV